MECLDNAGIKEVLLKAVSIIGELTPLSVDCGQLCDRACCNDGDGEETGMLLFPSEEKIFEQYSWGHTVDTEFVLSNGRVIRLFVCDEYCKRECRPLSCRIFPLFYDPDRDEVVTDVRGKGLCPLCFFSPDEEYDPDFVRAVHDAFEVLSEDDECMEFIRLVNDEFKYYF